MDEMEAFKLVERQSREILDWHREEPEPKDLQADPAAGLESWTTQLNVFNFKLWHLEDLARAPHATDAEIARVKRGIDANNQKRNDSIEKIDELILLSLGSSLGSSPGSSLAQNPSATLHSETVGALVDRLSINALKLFHMKEQAERTDVSEEHRERSRDRVGILSQQRQDLTQCLERLLAGLSEGRLRIKLYRQLKMYNDPSLNPAIYLSKPKKER